jgi:hypothetical protein
MSSLKIYLFQRKWTEKESEEISTDIKELLKLIFWCAKKEILSTKEVLGIFIKELLW